MKKNSVWFTGVLVLAAVCATLLAVRLQERVRDGGYTAEDKLYEAVDVIRRYYVGDRDEAAMTDAAIDGLVAGLGDQWSYYMTAEEVSAYNAAMDNSYDGLGITVQADPAGGIRVQAVYRQSPAGEAGLLPGSLLTAVNGQDLREAGLEEAVLLVRQAIAAGGVTLSLVEPDGTAREFTLTLGRVEADPVAYTMLAEGIGLITILNFDARSADQAIAALKDLQAQGASGFVFDVRNNPGGQLAELIKLLDYLLPEGPLFVSRRIDGTVNTEPSDAACFRAPMAVLINENSYSAAEFFAAALAEYDWAVTVGAQTSGKSYAQITVPLRDGSAIHISNIEYFTPKGVSLAGKGLTPAIQASLSYDDLSSLYYGLLDPAEDEQLQAALTALRTGAEPAPAS